MNRTEKIKLLTEVFQNGNKSLLKGTGKIVIRSVVVEKDGWVQIIPIEPNFEVPEKELTFKEFQDWVGCVPLFPDIDISRKL